MQVPSYYIEGLFRQGNAALARAYLEITTGAGTGDVTHSTGPLVLNELVVGNNLGDVKTFLAPGDGNLFLCGTTTPTWADPAGGMAWGRFRFDTSTVAGDPGSGKLRLNQNTWAAATQIFISDHSDPGTDVTSFLAMLTVGDIIAIQDRNDATKYARYDITGAPTDNGTWWTIPVTVAVSGGAVPGNNQSIGVVLFYGGGGGSGTVTNSANLTDNAVVVGDGGTTGIKTLAALGASGTVLTSNGAGVPPSFQAAAGTGNVTTGVTLTDHGVIVGNAGVDVVVTAVGATNTLLHGNTGADPTFSAVVEADLALTDVTTANAAVGQHGFLKKLSNVATEYMGGDGNWSVPQGTAVDYFWDYMEASILPVGTTSTVAYNCNRTDSSSSVLVLPTATVPVGMTLQTGAINGGIAQSTETQVNRMIYDRPMEWHGIFSIADITNIRFWCGVSNATVTTVSASNTPAGRFALFRFSSALDTNFRCYTNNNSTAESLDSGITPSNGQVYRFKITWDGTTTGKIKYYIDGALVQTSGIDMTAGDVFGMLSSMTMVTGSSNRTYNTYGMKSRIYYP